jgi:hypothetical protein
MEANDDYNVCNRKPQRIIPFYRCRNKEVTALPPKSPRYYRNLNPP